ncbi:hypothetical protein SDD27957_03710 [Streptococcus dysgalactiae subsp. dysgalactiae ATCC 27957]|nr:hypothetical protein SDD27957_03710 [Streptococcus dysgalactiae subsp. dysgalactiae ATCC 27957]
MVGILNSKFDITTAPETYWMVLSVYLYKKKGLRTQWVSLSMALGRDPLGECS